MVLTRACDWETLGATLEALEGQEAAKAKAKAKGAKGKAKGAKAKGKGGGEGGAPPSGAVVVQFNAGPDPATSWCGDCRRVGPAVWAALQAGLGPGDALVLCSVGSLAAWKADGPGTGRRHPLRSDGLFDLRSVPAVAHVGRLRRGQRASGLLQGRLESLEAGPAVPALVARFLEGKTREVAAKPPAKAKAKAKAKGGVKKKKPKKAKGKGGLLKYEPAFLRKLFAR